MKNTHILVALICLLISSSFIDSQNKTEVYLLNCPCSFGMNVHPPGFWALPEYIDTVEIKGANIQNLIDDQLSKLKDTSNAPVHTLIAIVRVRNEVKDTFYSEPLFKYWHKGDKSYVDTTGFFSRAFSLFLTDWYK